jgi:hypothetical protein
MKPYPADIAAAAKLQELIRKGSVDFDINDFHDAEIYISKEDMLGIFQAMLEADTAGCREYIMEAVHMVIKPCDMHQHLTAHPKWEAAMLAVEEERREGREELALWHSNADSAGILMEGRYGPTHAHLQSHEGIFSKEETLTNAHLIAAAPEGFAVIESAYIAILKHQHDVWRIKNQRLLADMRDYIAKATNQEPEAVQDYYEAKARGEQ